VYPLTGVCEFRFEVKTGFQAWRLPSFEGDEEDRTINNMGK
jgi:hypothetical protein